MFSRIKLYIGAIILFVLGIFGYGQMKKREGLNEKEAKDLKEDALKREKARESAFEEKRNVDGLSDSDLLDRLRRRGDDWGSL
jgi:hypothetical protein